MRTYVINLDAEPERWQGVHAELRAAGIVPQREAAVCGAAETSGYSPALNRRQYHRPLAPGEVGCYASHLAVWQRLVRSGDAMAAVFEDDVELRAPLAPLLDAIAALPHDWDIVKLVGRREEKIDARCALARGVDLISYRRVPSLTGAYVITRRGAQALLARHPPFGRPVDVDLRYWWECGLTVLGVQPYPVVEGESARRSTIDGRHPRTDLAMRARKLALQLHYSLANWHARRRAGAGRSAELFVQELEPRRT